MNGVPGWLSHDEARLLHDLAARQQAYGRCVELGAYQGRSAIAMASALSAGHTLLSVDTFAGSPEHQPGELHFKPETLTGDGSVSTLHLFRQHVAAAGLSDRSEAWSMPTTEAARRFEGPVSLLFVDSDHSYHSVSSDVAAWRPHLVAQAVIVLHDFGTWEGPTRCAADLLAAGYSRVTQAGTALAMRVPPASRGQATEAAGA